jgi:two-component system sensor histidine kinase AdeS
VIYKRLHLRTQLSIAMIFTSVMALVIFIIGMLGFYIYVEARWIASLSIANRTTLKALVENESVDAQALTTLVNVFSLSWSDGYAIKEVTAVLIFVLIAIVGSVFIGIVVARRLSQPIESVTDAALKVANGTFNDRLDHEKAMSIEAYDLLASFNKMTRYLASAERESTASAAAIAHELRTPLTVLRGRLQGMSDGIFEASPTLLVALLGQIDTLSHIVTDLETISHLDSGRLTFDDDVVDLADIARSVVTSTAPDIEIKGIFLEHCLQPALVRGDGARVRQALNALIANAYQYAAIGKYIRIETGVRDKIAYLSVVDKGPGICKENREKIFDRWWRVEKSRSRALGGRGLGLSVVKAIARAHGGDVKVLDGLHGKGVNFMLSIPRTKTLGSI